MAAAPHHGRPLGRPRRSVASALLSGLLFAALLASTHTRCVQAAEQVGRRAALAGAATPAEGEQPRPQQLQQPRRHLRQAPVTLPTVRSYPLVPLSAFALMTVPLVVVGSPFASAFGSNSTSPGAALVYTTARLVGLDSSLVALQQTTFPVLFVLTLGGANSSAWGTRDTAALCAAVAQAMTVSQATPVPASACGATYTPSGGSATPSVGMSCDVGVTSPLLPGVLAALLTSNLGNASYAATLTAALQAAVGPAAGLSNVTGVSFAVGGSPHVVSAPVMLVAVPDATAVANLTAVQRATLAAQAVNAALANSVFDSLMAPALPAAAVGASLTQTSLVGQISIQLYSPPPPPPPPSPPPQPPQPPSPPPPRPPPPPSSSPPPAPASPLAPAGSYLAKLKQGDEGSMTPVIFGIIIGVVVVIVCIMACIIKCKNKAKNAVERQSQVAALAEEGRSTPPELVMLRAKKEKEAQERAQKHAHEQGLQDTSAPPKASAKGAQGAIGGEGDGKGKEHRSSASASGRSKSRASKSGAPKRG